MSVKAFRNIFSSIMGIALLFTLMMPAGAASQSTPEPMYEFQAYKDTMSKDPGTGITYGAPLPRYTTAAKSFIYNDNALIPTT